MRVEPVFWMVTRPIVATATASAKEAEPCAHNAKAEPAAAMYRVAKSGTFIKLQ